jgi:hypothetical protein
MHRWEWWSLCDITFTREPNSIFRDIPLHALYAGSAFGSMSVGLWSLRVSVDILSQPELESLL